MVVSNSSSKRSGYIYDLFAITYDLFAIPFFCFVALRPKSTAMVIAGR